MNLENKKIAIVADWLIDFWWAELVISHLLEMFPDADIYTSVCFMDHPMLRGRRVYTSWLQKIPFLNRKHKLAGLLRPWAFRSFDLSGYDIVICSSSAESKQIAMGKWNSSEKWKVKSEKNGKKLWTLNSELWTQKPKVFVYCHTPIRYYWSHAKEYEDMMEFGVLNPLVKWVFRRVKWWMQRVDYEGAQKVNYFIANSRTTADRIKKYYDRDSEVIYPGVEPSILSSSEGCASVRSHTPGNEYCEARRHSSGAESLSGKSKEILASQGWQKEKDYYFGMSRCIPYKKLDLLVEAFNTSGKNLILATNTDNLLYQELKAKSKPNITWIFNPPSSEKWSLYSHAKAFLFPPEEDFGLVPVEAMMQWTPVIAYGKWGGTESVIDWETGLFFTPQTPEALNETIEKFEQMKWNKEKIKARGMEFSKERFQERIKNFIEKYVS